MITHESLSFWENWCLNFGNMSEDYIVSKLDLLDLSDENLIEPDVNQLNRIYDLIFQIN
jgi:hypothetical protein